MRVRRYVVSRSACTTIGSFLVAGRAVVAGLLLPLVAAETLARAVCKSLDVGSMAGAVSRLVAILDTVRVAHVARGAGVAVTTSVRRSLAAVARLSLPFVSALTHAVWVQTRDGACMIATIILRGAPSTAVRVSVVSINAVGAVWFAFVTCWTNRAV